MSEINAETMSKLASSFTNDIGSIHQDVLSLSNDIKLLVLSQDQQLKCIENTLRKINYKQIQDHLFYILGSSIVFLILSAFTRVFEK
uniref:Uncharacterized protein n=1 Tax=Spironucleus salmonicida TaxID=348837 RepID=V6LRE7_9EUKA|eukprot:EST47222.1 Hypothetical protein SS50377_12733 [Spironucleus salmonicida]